MGTLVHLVSYSSERSDAAQVELAFDAALREMDRLELLLSEWRTDSEVGRINQGAGQWVAVGAETLQLLQRAAWASKISGGAFDVSFQVLSSLWKFGSAQSE
ncbi:MAG TPA: FAD:protein FMN transferase, partial [Polyangiaceae bacterium]|nr:FAD:protein FMN transferase [Polyangiaceae bacterium]